MSNEMTAKKALIWLFLKASKQHYQLWAIKLTKTYGERKKLVDEITSDLDNHGGELNDTFHDVEQALNELEELKRYPTSEEVCEALSEYIKRPIEYYAVAKQFLIRCSNGYHEIARLHGNGEISFDITYCLPPHLITLIGRFYEGVGE